jgi:glycerophosphoryl diester phosphodiesterase
MRDFNDNIPIGILTETNPLKAMDIAQRLNAISINPYYKSLTKEIVHKIHDAGFQVYTWTVNEVEDLQRLKDWGVDGVFCNYPDRGKQIN